MDPSASPGEAREEEPSLIDRKGPSRQRAELSNVPGGAPRRPPQDTRRKRANEQRYAGWGDGIERVVLVPAPNSFSPKPFLSRPTPAPPPFPRPSWRGAPTPSYFAPSVTTGRTAGPMASSSTRDLRDSRRQGDPGGSGNALNSSRHAWDARTQKLTVRGGKGEPDRQSGG